MLESELETLEQHENIMLLLILNDNKGVDKLEKFILCYFE